MFELKQNYPNPFRSSLGNKTTDHHTTISFDVKETSEINLSIFNVKGQLVRQLLEDQALPGKWQVTWDGLDRFGKKVVPGIYLYKLRANNFTTTRLMTVR
jgi:flagellar hook assembly protein FlgD